MGVQYWNPKSAMAAIISRGRSKSWKRRAPSLGGTGKFASAFQAGSSWAGGIGDGAPLRGSEDWVPRLERLEPLEFLEGLEGLAPLELLVLLELLEPLELLEFLEFLEPLEPLELLSLLGPPERPAPPA